LRDLGLAQFHPKPGSLGATAVGGLIFGVGFGLLGYCPEPWPAPSGTATLDALLGGAVGMLIGSGLFAAVYPKLQGGILKKGDFGELTIPRALRVNAWAVVVPAAAALVGLLVLIEKLDG
jgi:uncharacterized protein